MCVNGRGCPLLQWCETRVDYSHWSRLDGGPAGGPPRPVTSQVFTSGIYVTLLPGVKTKGDGPSVMLHGLDLGLELCAGPH